MSTATTEPKSSVNEAKSEAGLAASGGSAPGWKCDLGNGEWDHDWQEYFESSGEVDGGPGEHWSYSICLACGAKKEEP